MQLTGIKNLLPIAWDNERIITLIYVYNVVNCLRMLSHKNLHFTVRTKCK